MKNKILLTLEVQFGDDVILVADNLKDLEDYLLNELGFYSVTFSERDNLAIVREKEWFSPVNASIKWIKQI